MANKEAWEYEQESAEIGKKAAQDLENMINSSYGRHGARAFINYLTYNTHPYLRQELFKVALGFIAEMAESNRHDGRDISAAETARYVVDKLNSAWDNDRTAVLTPRRFEK